MLTKTQEWIQGMEGLGYPRKQKTHGVEWEDQKQPVPDHQLWRGLLDPQRPPPKSPPAWRLQNLLDKQHNKWHNVWSSESATALWGGKQEPAREPQRAADQRSAECVHIGNIWQESCKQWLWWLIIMRPQNSKEKPLAEKGWHFHVKTRWDRSQVKDVPIKDHTLNWYPGSVLLSFLRKYSQILELRILAYSNSLCQTSHPPGEVSRLTPKTWSLLSSLCLHRNVANTFMSPPPYLMLRVHPICSLSSKWVT